MSAKLKLVENSNLQNVCDVIIKLTNDLRIIYDKTGVIYGKTPYVMETFSATEKVQDIIDFTDSDFDENRLYPVASDKVYIFLNSKKFPKVLARTTIEPVLIDEITLYILTSGKLKLSLSIEVDEKQHACYHKDVLDNAPSLIWTLQHGLTTYLNKKFRDTLNIECDDAVNWVSIVHPSDLDVILKNVEGLISKEKKYFDVDHRMKKITDNEMEDNYRWYNSKGVLMSQHDGFDGIIGVVTDIHNNMVLEKENRELAVKEAISSSTMKLKRDFISLISHEVRTPLNAVIGMVNLLLSTDLSNEQTEFVNTMNNSVKVLMSIIDDILEFSLLETKTITIRNDILNLDTLMTDVMNLLKPMIRKKNVKIVIKHHKNHRPIRYGDAARLKQIFLNILGNAVKFTSEGYVYVDIICRDAETDIIKFIFRDTGVGMNLSVKNILFEAFVQGDISLSRKYGGLGLGMYICKKLIDMMHGVMGIESAVGSGTSIVVSIPLPLGDDSIVSNDVLSPLSSEHVRITVEILEQLKKHVKILYAEDNKVNQIIMKKSLEKLGYKNITIASDGVFAVELFNLNKYHIIFLDQSMPRMNGDEVCKYIRSKDSDQLLISVSANLLVKELARFSDLGMNDYMTKPLSVSDLELKVTKWVKYLYLKNELKPVS